MFRKTINNFGYVMCIGQLRNIITLSYVRTFVGEVLEDHLTEANVINRIS